MRSARPSSATIISIGAALALTAAGCSSSGSDDVEPAETFALRALSVQDPFAPAPIIRYDLRRICAEQQATLVPDRLASVDLDRRVVRTASGHEERFDSLLLALGARPVPVYDQAMTYRGASDAAGMRALLRDIERGLIDFPALVAGRPVFLCWELGESDVAFWHEVETGYGSRRPLIELA